MLLPTREPPRVTLPIFPLERLALSPQCGFASTMEGNAVTEADQEAKLRLVAETAAEVWGNGRRRAARAF